MSVGIEGRRQRGAVVQGFEVFASDGSEIEGRRQRGAVVHSFRGVLI
jgi:hypothetical protein